MFARVASALLCLALAFAMMRGQAQAAAGTISFFGATSSGSITYAVTDVTQSRKPGTPATYSFLLSVKTGTLAGTVTLTAPKILGATGAIPQKAFWASCVETSDPGGIFTSAGVVQLGTAAVSCGTLAANKNNNVSFTVNLFLDDTSGATAFPADAAYAAAALSVTANAP